MFTFLYILGSLAVNKQNIYSSGCSGERINLVCPENHKIAIKRLFYGIKNDARCSGNGRHHSVDCCQPTHSDCLVVDDRKYPVLNMLCSGQRGCDIAATSIESGPTCHAKGYGNMTNYMSVIHDCIPGVYLLCTFCKFSVCLTDFGALIFLILCVDHNQGAPIDHLTNHSPEAPIDHWTNHSPEAPELFRNICCQLRKHSQGTSTGHLMKQYQGATICSSDNICKIESDSSFVIEKEFLK